MTEEPDEPELQPEPIVVSPGSADFRLVRFGGFEEIFGRRLPIWMGGVTLAVAGFLIVKYSIGAGLLSPAVRVIPGLLFGGRLIAGAEVARRQAEAVRDPRIAQALAGAGIAGLYGSIVAAATLYGLVGSATAFAGLVAVTALAGRTVAPLRRSERGVGPAGRADCAGAGRLGSPRRAAALRLSGARRRRMCALGRSQRWWWLGAAALAGGLGWRPVLVEAV